MPILYRTLYHEGVNSIMKMKYTFNFGRYYHHTICEFSNEILKGTCNGPYRLVEVIPVCFRWGRARVVAWVNYVTFHSNGRFLELKHLLALRKTTLDINRPHNSWKTQSQNITNENEHGEGPL